MKNVLNVCIAMLILASVTGQETNQDRNQLAVEQQATLRTKKMALQLDLTPDQEEKIYQLQLGAIAERKAKKEKMQKPEKTERSPEEKYQQRIAHLDQQIAHQQKVKNILNPEQYEQWKRMSQRHKNKRDRKPKGKKTRQGK